MIMGKPTILYIDEQEDERSNFIGDAFASGYFAQVEAMMPMENIDDTVDCLLGEKFDALVTDYNFSDGAAINYNGEDVVRKFLHVRRNFPCFIRTSWERDALDTAADVNLVYSKHPEGSERTNATIFDRIVRQIDRHAEGIESAKAELADLLKKDPNKMSAPELERLVELDGEIEQSYGADHAISAQAKKNLLNRNSELLEKTQQLIAEIEVALAKK